MTLNRLLKVLLNVNGATVIDARFNPEENGLFSLVAELQVGKRDRWRCPVCGRKCNVHDYSPGQSRWRGMDLGPLKVFIEAKVPRVECPEHGVLLAAVPWASHRLHFTTDFAYSAAWMFRSGLSKTKVSECLHIDWDTVGRLVDFVWRELEPDPRKRFDGLVNIGVDETSYRKGYSYITVIVNHDTNTVVWAHVGHGKEVLDMFFRELTPEQRASIRVVTGDGARWISDSVAEFCPNAERCVDPFHVVEWANDTLESLRLDAWRRARLALADAMENARMACSPNPGDCAELRERVEEAKAAVKGLKDSKYALGKNASNLTDRQRERLAMIQAEDGPLARGYRLKERLKAVFSLKDPALAEECLDKWIRSAQHCRIPAFVELQRKIRRHRKNILNTIKHGLSNARVEATNNKIKLLIRISYGFRNIDNMIALIMLFCSCLEIPWPSTSAPMRINKGVASRTAA